MSEELINTVYILATISQHIEFPFRNSWLSKIFQNAFTSGIDKESLRELGYLTGRSLSGTFHYVREIIRFQKCEDIFAWPNKLLHPFQVSDIPKNIEKAAFFITCTNKDYIEEIEGYILVVKLFQPEGILECKHGEEWKSCSSQKMGNYKPKNFSVILGFVKNWEDIKIEEKTVEENKDNEAKTKNVEKSPQDFEENTTKNINADQINEKLRQMEEELSKSKLSNECLQAELMREKLKNKNTSSNMHRVKVMIENMSKKIYNTRIDLEKKLIYLKERAEESQLCIKNILDNCQSKFNQLQSFVDDSAGSKNELDNKKPDFSIAFNAISDYFQCSNKTAQDCLQKFKELGNECYSLKEKCNEIINEIDSKPSSLIAKNNEREEKTKKIFRSENSSVSRFSHFPALKRKKYGLVNIGNSCHLNSVLQIFASIPNFIEKIRNIENNLFYSLGEVLSSITDPYPFLNLEN
ncbi:unnamed protein product [Blepharisma stoltei]|uniref:USP domain-containing protein n=1 Tax=Blepharisma stoltei TaxID=1481888 RepID=A0AAU9ING3_9CILI|nr:unnamed protein product [Blepharisma stoltei]